MVGKVYNIPPQPPVAENTRSLPAGAITFGVEYRDLDPESLIATYADNAAHLAQLGAAVSPEGGFSDEGVSIHVSGADDGHEYLRFDLFDDKPHYHYIHRPGEGGEIANNVVEFDATALGEMLPWAIERLRSRLPDMLREAGGAHLIEDVDPELVGRVLGDVEALAARAREAHWAAAGRLRP